MTFDAEKLAERCIAFEREGDVVRVKLDKASEPWIRVLIVDGELALFPQRSSGHKKLHDRLG